MISALIVDDEKSNCESLQKLLKENCPDVMVVDEAHSSAEAIQSIEKHKPQLVFLDIEMPRENGFDLLRKLDKIDFKIIFITAHSHYAIKAIKFSAVDYLLKPMDSDDLRLAVGKAIGETGKNHQVHNNGLLDNIDAGINQKLAVPVKDGLAFLALNDIIRLEADGTYTYIFVRGEKFTATKNIKEYEDILVERRFFRSHKSHLVNLNHVAKFSRLDGYFIQMSDGSRAEVSRRKQEEFLEMMGKK